MVLCLLRYAFDTVRANHEMGVFGSIPVPCFFNSLKVCLLKVSVFPVVSPGPVKLQFSGHINWKLKRKLPILSVSVYDSRL